MMFEQQKAAEMQGRVYLSETPRALHANYGKTVHYQKVWAAVADARLPAEKQPDGRWVLSLRDVAELFELTEPAAAA
jgi:hypothetical protein